MRLSVQEIAKATGARLLCGAPDTLVHGVSTDTRSLRPGELFLALSGPNFDGNGFAAAALERGATALLLRAGEAAGARELFAELPAGIALLVHPDPKRALIELATWYRRQLSARVVAITGSAGKTSTKNMLVELLRPLRQVVGSEKSYNNDIGVPLTILSAGRDTQVLVVEIGTNQPGEIAALCRIAQPDIGIITMIGAAHLEKLSSLEGVALEKGALVECLPARGLAILNGDGRFLEQLRSRTRARVATFSVHGGGDLCADSIVFRAGGTCFRLRGRELCVPLLGTHNVANLLAVLLACEELGVALDELLVGIAGLAGSQQRLERRELAGITLLDDSYNCNPESARAALHVLQGLSGYRRRVLVLGDMRELGPLAGELHYAIGAEAARAGLDLLVLVGELMRAAAAGASEAGASESSVVHLADTASAAQRLPQLAREGDVVLVKGSRSMQLERVVEALAARFSRPAALAPSAPKAELASPC